MKLGILTLLEAHNFRCLRYVQQRLGPFHVLVGPNASGKTTFLDIAGLLGDLAEHGLDAAIEKRTPNFEELVWRRQAQPIELAVEARIPEERLSMLPHRRFDTIRYEVAIGVHSDTEEVALLAEKAVLKGPKESSGPQRELFPAPIFPPDTILTPTRQRDTRTVVNKVAEGNDNFYDETDKHWDHSFKLGPRRSALANLPEDETKFPVSTWFKSFLIDGIQSFVLNSLLIRKASRPGQGLGFKPDGSNLPWIVADLMKKAPERHRQWVAHLTTALPDLEDIDTVERKDDKHRYLVLRYRGGIEVPSWLASDGTLRLLALTLPAYRPDFKGMFLIEEPENGIHPRAVETMFQSLSSVYDAQILLATHSPVILSIVQPEQVLCLAKNEEGASDIVPGNQHPALREWRGETDLGTLFASGVLG